MNFRHADNRRARNTLCFALLAFSLTHCMKEQQRGVEKSHNLIQLARLVNLPAQPLEATYASQEMGSPGIGPNDWLLEVWIRFEPGALAKIVSESKRLKPGEVSVSSEKLPSWMKEQWKAPLPEDHVYDASRFYKSPLLDGYFVVLSKDQIYLYLHTS